jgi:hypothetical protein
MDVFSFGVLMYELLYESYPFDYSSCKYEQYRCAYHEKNYSKLVLVVPEKTNM